MSFRTDSIKTKEYSAPNQSLRQPKVGGHVGPKALAGGLGVPNTYPILCLRGTVP